MIPKTNIPPSIKADSINAIVATELRAVGELVNGNIAAAGASLNDAARRIDELLGGEGRLRLRYRPKAVVECIHIILEMIPHQVSALPCLYDEEESEALSKIHGHASALWRITAFLHDIITDPSRKPEQTVTEPKGSVDDEKRQLIVESLDDLLDGPFHVAVIEPKGRPVILRFLRRDDHLMLDFPVAALDESERYKSLLFFHRIGGPMGGWDEVSLSDNDFSFMLEMGINLDRSARVTLDLFREVLGLENADLTLRLE